MYKLSKLILALSTVFFAGYTWAIEDPTKPPVRAKIQHEETTSWPVLQSILFGDQRRLALLSDQLLSEGDEGEGFEVVRIFQRGVVVRKHGELRRLSLNRGKVHKEVK